MSALNSFIQKSSIQKDQNWRLMLQTRQSFLIAILSIVLSVMLAIFAILPQIQQVFSDREEVQLKQDELTKLQTKVNKLLELKDFVQSDRIQKVDLILPSGKPLLELMAATQYTASVSGVSVFDVLVTPGLLASSSAQQASAAAQLDSIQATGTIVTPTGTPAELNAQGLPTRLANGADSLDVSMKVLGTLAQINQFLSGVERQTPFTNITSFKLDAATIQSPTPINEPLFEAEITLTTYSYARPISVALDTPVPDIGPTEQAFLDKLEDFSYARIALPTEVLGGGLEDLFKVSIPSPAP